MAKVVVYRYRVYDAREDECAISTRMATRAKIKQIRGEIIPGTKTEIDDKHLEGGWTVKGFVERLAANLKRGAAPVRTYIFLSTTRS